MQRLPARNRPRGRVVVFVPRWLEASSPSGLPYRVIPVLSSLTANGYAVDLFTEVHDGVVGDELRDRLLGCAAAVAWCAELNPGIQVPGLLAFLEFTRATDPSIQRIAGGGFFALLPPPRLELAPLTDAIIAGQEVDALSAHLTGSAGDQRDRAPFDVDAMWQLDLRPFLRPEAMLFGNDEPSLQLPTAAGCGKRCSFCFYERSPWRVLPASGVVDLVAAMQERYGVSQFLFGDLDFLASRRRAVDVARGLVDRGLVVRWFALGSVGDLLQLTDDELALLAASGCVTLELGLEAGSDAALRRLGKKFTTADSLTAHARLVQNGITPVYNFVFGWPGETRADQRATERLIGRLHRSRVPMRFNFRIYQAIPSTTMGERALALLPALPHDLAELRAYREDDDRRLPWLSRSAERRVRFLVEYVLPLAYDDALCGGGGGRRRRALATIARWRSRSGFLRWPFDRSVFRQTATVGLPRTYLA